jgi:hypothetical protein
MSGFVYHLLRFGCLNYATYELSISRVEEVDYHMLQEVFVPVRHYFATTLRRQSKSIARPLEHVLSILDHVQTGS